MKPYLGYAMVPVALAGGILIGRQGGGAPTTEAEAARSAERRTVSERTMRGDPFGGPAFSLSSMDDVRALYARQRSAVATARLTIQIEALSAAEIPALVEMVKEDQEKFPQYDQGRWQMLNALMQRWVAVDPDGALAYLENCRPHSFQRSIAGNCFSGLAAVDPERGKVELQSLPSGELRQNAAQAFAAELGLTDPQAALDILRDEAPSSGRWAAQNILARWAATDPHAAAAALDKLPPDLVDEDSASQVAAAWAARDPEAALAWAKSVKGPWRAEATMQVYQVLSRDDPAGAWAQAASEPGHLRARILGGILQTVADRDSDEALRLLRSLQGSERRIATEQLLNQMYWGNWEFSRQVVAEIDDPTVRREQLGNLMYRLAWSAPEQMREEIARMDERDRIAMSRQVLNGLTRRDPAEAEKFFLSLPEAQRDAGALNDMMRQYAHRDPAAAFEFARKLDNPQEQRAALDSLFGQWSRSDPEAAAAEWRKLPPGESRLGALGQIAGSWAQADPTSAEAWAANLSGDERVRAMAAILPATTRDDPAAAAAKLGALLASPSGGMAKTLAESAGNLARTWAADDPQSATAWASSLPAGQSQEHSYKAISQAWSGYDAVATAGWLSTIPEGDARNAAVQPFVSQVRQSDPATAFSWAATIGNETQRVNELRETLTSWRKTDQAAARAALQGIDLSEQDRASLMKEVE